MASNLVLIVLLVFVSLSLTCGYSPRTLRDAVSKQDDDSYVMATSDQESSMVVVEDIVKGRLLARTVVNKSASKSPPSKSLTKKHKSFKIGPLNVALGVFIGIIIAAVVVFIAIVGVICFFIVLCIRHKTKKSTEEGSATEKTNGSLENQTSKAEDHV
ncbi:hypothetical protein ARALYDRAFT_334057 [Arabidopsis lyrata subsp. lyrata]|uniref:Transmembrane protein n=1 Tax=Arabidopsis lyrata subsp. lyrata TaxID=81972 RepID=D7KH46_ARALL|nr:uncharacterized protein LOC9325720 isoform X3 [Arabidopsis lyrata subsp. lyrata]EFH65915.1 hypothetical protein ARALYDRAFT_334057 [Arabidopsis lyrata subsp. lyrata]|eukprot:XP_002889656.1 uncharacterized protein LOC9325720 isoform X3 [Arabidopsis lyrata subsp. lyrata]